MPPRLGAPPLLVHLVYVTGLAGLALVAGQAPVVIATRLHSPSSAARDPTPSSCGETSRASPSQTYRSLETLARAAARREWQGRVDELTQQLTRERERAAEATAALQARRSPIPPPRPPTPPPVEVEPPARPTHLRRPPGTRVSAGTTRVRLIGSDALVTGTLRNAGDRDASIRLTVELLLDRHVLERTRMRLLVPARSSLPWGHTFPTSLAEGTYAARVRLEP